MNQWTKKKNKNKITKQKYDKIHRKTVNELSLIKWAKILFFFYLLEFLFCSMVYARYVIIQIALLQNVKIYDIGYIRLYLYLCINRNCNSICPQIYTIRIKIYSTLVKVTNTNNICIIWTIPSVCSMQCILLHINIHIN